MHGYSNKDGRQRRHQKGWMWKRGQRGQSAISGLKRGRRREQAGTRVLSWRPGRADPDGRAQARRPRAARPAGHEQVVAQVTFAARVSNENQPGLGGERPGERRRSRSPARFMGNNKIDRKVPCVIISRHADLSCPTALRVQSVESRSGLLPEVPDRGRGSARGAIGGASRSVRTAPHGLKPTIPTLGLTAGLHRGYLRFLADCFHWLRSRYWTRSRRRQWPEKSPS
jgi:hypothetical protein